MKKSQPEYRFDTEQHVREAVERKFKCSARLETALTSHETRDYTVMLFQLDNPDQKKVYAWVQPREEHPSIPTVKIVPVSDEVSSEAAAVDFENPPIKAEPE
jgi:hypothetical protein